MPAGIRNVNPVTPYPVAASAQETLLQATSTTTTLVTASNLKDLLSGQASTIKKITHFTAGSLGYEFFKLTTYFDCLSFMTNSETKKVIREITALDNLTGQIRSTTNKVAKILQYRNFNTSSGSISEPSVEKLVTLAKQLARLEQHNFLGSKEIYVEALGNLVENNTAGFLGTSTNVHYIEEFKAYLLREIEKTAQNLPGTIPNNTTPSTSEPRASEQPPRQRPKDRFKGARLIIPQDTTQPTPARRDSLDSVLNRDLPPSRLALTRAADPTHEAQAEPSAIATAAISPAPTSQDEPIEETQSLLFDRIENFVRSLPAFSDNLIWERLKSLGVGDFRTIRLVMNQILTPDGCRRIEKIINELLEVDAYVQDLGRISDDELDARYQNFSSDQQAVCNEKTRQKFENLTLTSL